MSIHEIRLRLAGNAVCPVCGAAIGEQCSDGAGIVCRCHEARIKRRTHTTQPRLRDDYQRIYSYHGSDLEPRRYARADAESGRRAFAEAISS